MIFSIKDIGERPYEYWDRVHKSLSFEMSMDLATVDREVYTALDWVGDLGGLFDGMKLIFSLVLAILTYKNYDTYMVAKLFQLRSNEAEQGGGKKENKLIRGLTNYFKGEIN